MKGQVEVYFNLHKRLFSVRESGRVIAHLPFIVLRDCTFAVQPAGLRRVRETGVKNVHAFVRGAWDRNPDTPFYIATAERVRYNPYISDTFFVVNDKQEVGVRAAQLVQCEITDQRTPIMWGWYCEHTGRGKRNPAATCEG